MAEENTQHEGNGRGDGIERHDEDRARADDVVLDVPEVKVDQIHLRVEELNARLSLDAAVAQQFVRLKAGVDVELGKLELDISGVEAEAHLRVKLDNVVRIVQEALATLRERPELIQSLAGAVEGTTQNLSQGLGNAVPGLTQNLGKSAKRLADDVQVTGGAKKIQHTAKASVGRLKRTFAQVASKLPIVGTNEEATA